MKIAILTSGVLPVPAVKGGAVENLADFYLEYNEKHGLHDITVYSVTDSRHPIPKARLDERHNHYVQWKADSLSFRLAKKLHSKFSDNAYYDHQIDCYLHKALQRMKGEHYDLVILENRPGYAESLKAAFDIPIVLHLHNDLLNAKTWRGEAIAKRLAGVVCVSDYIKGRVETICPAEICKTVHNGIDTNNFKRTCNKAEMRRRLHLDMDDYVAIYSGRLIREKGVKELIEAIAKIDDPKVKLVIMGASFFAGSGSSDAYTEELRAVARPLAERIVFTGFVDYRDVPSYLSMADLAVIPSLWDEPLGLTCAEAISVGLPVVATNAGGIPEVVSEPNILIERGEGLPQRLAEAIVRMKEHPIVPQSLPSYYDKDIYSENFWKAIKLFTNRS